jgi:TonB-dependent starch-binding outer membrane protein SusC
MRKLHVALIVCLIMLSLNVLAQRVVTGKVVSKTDGAPLKGATVQIKGTNTTSLTDDLGAYSINVPANGRTLVISYTGFAAQEVAVGRGGVVVLEASSSELQAVVVTGYKSAQKKSFVGSAATVKGDEIAAVPVASFDQALQGKTPGVILRATSGQPGASGDILVRGRGSIQGATSPLFIVDGIQIAAADFAQINQNDIENLSVLKDAIATSLYGSRGANGVIVVTTKRGNNGKPKLEIDAFTGWSSFPTFQGFRLMTTNEKIDYELRRGGTSLESYTTQEIDSLRQINTDWEKEITRVARTYSVNASASGGNDKQRYFASINYFNQEGTVRNTGFDRITGRINLSQEVGNFSFGLNATGAASNLTNTSEQNAGISTPLNAGQWTNPFEQPFAPGRYSPAGNFIRGGSTLTRQRVSETFQPIPTTELFWNNNKSLDYRVVAALNAEYKIPFIKGLSVRTVYGVDYRQFNEERFVDRRTNSAGSNPRPTSGQFANYRTSSFARNFFSRARITNTNSINYTKDFGEHHLDLGAYYETVDVKDRNNGRTVFLLESPFQNEAGATINAELLPRVNAGGANAVLQSYFGLLNYGFKNKYFFSANIRRDGSSRFGADKRYGTFGGVGAAWLMSDEDFMASTAGWLNLLKVKASYGSVGNQEGIGAYEAQGALSGRLYNATQGTTVLAPPIDDLQWEDRTKFNIGIEFGLFKNRLNGTIDFYNENTNQLFLPTELSRTTGFNNLTRNVGSLNNRGVEIGVNYDIVRTKDLRFSFNANATFNQNKITRLTERDTIVSGIVARIVGQPVQSLFVVEYAGVNPANGNAQYRKLDGSLTETYDQNDRKIVGNADPTFFGGFGTTLSYKGLSFVTQFSYMSGMRIFNNERNNLENPDYYVDNVNADLLTEWKSQGDVTNIPRPGDVYVANTTRFIENNSFLRLRTVSLSYNLPSSLLNKIKFRSIQVYVSGFNLLTFTGYRGRDPESANASQTGAQYPAMRMVQTGLRLGF